MSITYTLEAMYIDTPDLTMTFHNWRTRYTGYGSREVCDVTVTDGTNTVELTEYSPSPMHSEVEEYVDDVLTFINGGNIEKEPGDPLYEAWRLWEDKYMSPLEETEDDE